MFNRGRLLLLIGIFAVFVGSVLASEWSDDPYEIKMANYAVKHSGTSNKVILANPDAPRPKNITEKIIENGFKRYELPDPRSFPEEAAAYLPEMPPTPITFRPSRTTPPSARPAPPAPDVPGSEMSFHSEDVLVSIPNADPQRQPHCVTGDDGTIYAVWGQAVSGGANAIMFSKSTDAGATWSEAVVVDAVGTNYSPRVAVYGSGSSARVHVVYNYVDWHTYDYYDSTGAYLYTDTVSEGDVYYCRSNTAGATFGHYQAIANNDIDLIILHFNYDEGGADIHVDDHDDVAISYYSQADEGHIMMLALYIIYIIVTGSLPPFWIDYTWYEVDMRGSSNHGGSFDSQHEIVNEWFMDNSLCGSAIEGSGSAATLHCVYTNTGVLSLGSADSWYRQVTNPFFSPSNHLDEYVASGYPVPGGVCVDTAGNPRVGITEVSGWGYDVHYNFSTDGGHTWPTPTPVAVSSNDAWEPRLRLDDAQNTFLTWSDERHIDTDVYCVWSEDGGLTLRSDQHKVNQHPGSYDQLWPGMGLFLSDTTRRLDVVWWDTWSDPDGDIYYNGANWWRTNLNVVLHDTLANPMGGTLTLTYTSMDVFITREISTGYHIIYHDPGTEICLDRISSGSDATERWIYSETEDFCVTPPVPGNTYNLVYYDQYYTTFTTEIGNPPACTVTDIPSMAFTYEFFDLTEVDFTDYTHWANVRGEYNYTPAVPSDPEAVERWYCPEPNGLVLSPTVAPVYYYQYKATFLDPRRLNDSDCSHPVPHFALEQRWMGGENAGGTTVLTDWADCGSIYEYEDPKNISEGERWDITYGASGVVDGLGPYMPGAYHQWKPQITLIGPYLPENPTYCETLYVGGVRTGEANLYGLYSPWADCGSPLWMGEFTSLGWVARDPRTFDPVTDDFMAIIRYGNVVTVVLENDFGYGFVVGDGDTVTSGFPIGWAPSTDHNICAISPQEFGFVRYVFDHWSDGGDTCHDVYPISDTTFTAFFNKEYYLQILSDYDTPWGDGWWPEGASAEFGVSSIGDSAGGIRYIFDHWEGTGVGSYTGTDTSQTVVMNNPITERAVWNAQFRLIVDYTGTDTLVPGQSGDGWYSSGEYPIIASDSIIGDDGEGDTLRYVFDHWESSPDTASFGDEGHARTEIWMTRPYTATAVYRKQWRFTVESTDSSLGSPDPAIGSHWVFDGDSVHAEVTSPDAGSYCTGYLGYGSLSDGSLPWLDFVIRQPSGVTWMWGDQYIFNVTSDPYTWIMDMASPDPARGVWYYVPLTRDTFRVDEFTPDMGGTRYHCTGFTGSGPAAAGGDANWVELVINSSGEIRWQFTRQLRFVVTSEHGSPDPSVGVHWFDEYTDVDPNVDPIDGDWRCVGYTLFTGGVPSTGIGSSFALNIAVPCSLDWAWANVSDVESLYVYSDHGPTVPGAGVWNYFFRGTDVNAFAALYDLSDAADGIQWKCTGWTGTGIVPPLGYTNICSLSMDESGTITWTWTPQYLVHVECANDNPRFSLNGGLTWDDLDTVEDIWVPGDARILISVDYIDTITAVGGGDSVVFCENWTGIGSCLDGLDRTVLDLDFTATSPCSIFFNWSSLLVPLYVYSDHDSPVPSDTSYWVPGTVVDAFVTTPAYDGVDGERWLCTGWVGTGDVPRTGDHPILSFTIEDTSSITWQWQHEYRLTIDSWPTTYDSPFPADGEHWYPAGDSIYGNVTSPVWSGTDTMYCIGFDGTGSAPPISPQIEFGFYLDEPSEVTWKWLPRDSVSLLIVLSDYDSPRPYGTTAWRICDPVYAHVDSFVYVGTDRIDCIGWRGGGSVAPTGDLNHMNFNICEDSYIQWQWSTVYFFEVQNPGGYGDPEPDVGVYTYSAGAYVNGEMRDNPYWTGSDTMFCVGYHGWGDLPPTDPHTDFDFHITTNSGLEWQWSNVAYRLTVNSAYGSPWPHGTTYWIPRALVHGATVDSVVLVSPDIRARCIGWTGTGSVPAAGDSNVIPDFFMMEDGSITWRWALQYAFYVTNEGPGADGYDSPVPSPGTYWFDEGDTVTAYITENPVWSVPRADSMYCIGMTGTGSAPIWSPQDSIQFVINVPSSCNWHWLWSDTVAMLVVNSAHDSPMPWGTTYWPLYSDVMAMVDPTDDVDSLSRYYCTGFDITGSVDSTDTFTFIDFIIDTATELTWNWTGQYYLTLLWEGITTPPTFVGEGWYNEGDTALFECETPVFDAGGYYGFAYWDFDPDTVIHGDSLIFHSWVEMREPTIARAHYAPGVHVQVLKLPDDDDCGWIAIDSIFYDSTAIYTSWWGRGSYHDLLVPDVDSTASGQRFMFERWSDGLPIGHRVGPITDADTLWTAFYTSQYLAVIAKNPPHTWGFIYADGDTFHDEAAHVFWWSPGPPHEIGVSTPDSSEFPVSDTIRYFFKDWTATGDTSSFDTIPMITTDSIGGPVSYRANYDPKILLHLEKVPPHPYGYLTIDNDTIRDASVFDYWCDPGETPYIGASEFDIVDYHVGGTDSVWEYRNWSDGGLIVHEVGPIDAPASYTAYYDVDTVIMAFSVTPNFWDVGDIHVVETATMVDTEVVVFENEGNVPLDIGFIISDPGPWMAGVTRGHDKFSLYVHLNDESTVPTAFNPILDWVKSDLLVWAVNGSSGRFGVGGENILPPTHYSGADVSENIWMQFGSPMSSSAGYGAETLVLAVYAKYHMP